MHLTRTHFVEEFSPPTTATLSHASLCWHTGCIVTNCKATQAVAISTFLLSGPPQMWDTNQTISNISCGKLSNIHCTSLKTVRRHLYQCSTPYSWLDPMSPSPSSFTEQGLKTGAAGILRWGGGGNKRDEFLGFHALWNLLISVGWRD